MVLEQIPLFGAEEPTPPKPTSSVTLVDPPTLKAGVAAEREPAVTKKKSPRGRKSVRELEAIADLVDIPSDDVLFQKQYYTIGEVASMFHANTSLIRYWETEFVEIKPRKNKKGDRYFTPEDIKTLQWIHFLLRHKKLTIEGAKEFLKSHGKEEDPRIDLVRSLEQLRAFLLELKAQL